MHSQDKSIKGKEYVHSFIKGTYIDWADAVTLRSSLLPLSLLNLAVTEKKSTLSWKEELIGLRAVFSM